LTGTGGPSSTYKYPRTVPTYGRLRKLLVFRAKLCKHTFHPLVGSTCPVRLNPNIWRPPWGLRKTTRDAPPSELIRRLPHPLTMWRRQRYWWKRKARPSRTTPPKRHLKMTLSTAKDSAKTIPPLRALYAPAAPKAHHKHHRQASLTEGEDTIEDGEVIGISTKD
jgi:hypothetical protein